MPHYMTTSDHTVDIEKQTQYANDDVASERHYVVIGKTRVPLSDVMEAFGGDLNPGRAIKSKYGFANPGPLGLSGFALTTFVLSVVNVGGLGLKTPAVVIGLAYFYGGLAQFCAGMWEIAVGNTFGATALGSYGAFWMSWAVIETGAFGIAEAYEDDPGALGNAVGFYLTGWLIFTVGLCLCTVKSTLAFFSLFFSLSITFLLLAIGNFTGSEHVITGGGAFGLLTAVIAWYNAYAGIATPENSYLTVRPIYLPGSDGAKQKRN